MTQSEKPIRPLEPKRPNPMQGERALTLREAMEILIPRWAKRRSRPDRSS